jgi:hypothetical protein
MIKSRIVGVALVCCAVSAATWFGIQWWPQRAPQDFEQCSEEAERISSSEKDSSTLVADCGKRFVGRRKIDGGYTYYDFLQNRHFDIAGPNPTPKELRQFDEQYMLYLDAQRSDDVSSAVAETQSRTAQTDLQNNTSSISPPGLPLAITPTIVPVPKARNSVMRSKSSCEDGPLSCGWIRFSSGISKFFESNAKMNRP